MTLMYYALFLIRSVRKPDAGRVIENPCTMPQVDVLENILGQPKGMTSDRSKRLKLDHEGR